MKILKRNQLMYDDLVQGCINNSRVHQKNLYDNYASTMYSLVFRMVNDRELSNDVMQDAFIQIFQTISELQDVQKLSGWIRTIVVRTAIQYLRERKKITFEDLHQIPDVVLPDDNFTAIQLDEAILSLPKGNRLVFMLIEVEGYKHREVAEMLQITEGTSKSQLNYAKKLLRQKLSEYKLNYATK